MVVWYLDWGIKPRDPQMCKTAKELGMTIEGNARHMHCDDPCMADCIVVFTQRLKDELTKVIDFNRWNRIALFDELAYGQ